ncbi:hypothetical protein LXL04_038697 [Taraxacum kok-saghyz]
MKFMMTKKDVEDIKYIRTRSDDENQQTQFRNARVMGAIMKLDDLVAIFSRLALHQLLYAGILPRKRSSDDDDFVRTPPPYFTKTVQVSSEPFPCLNTRFPSERLLQITENLNDQQKACLEAIGFCSSLTMRLGKPPRIYDVPMCS